MYHREKLIIFLIVLSDYAALNGIASVLPALLLSSSTHGNSSAYFTTHSVLWIDMTITLYAVGQSIGSLFWGKWSDHCGRKPILQLTLVLNALGLFVAYLSIIFQKLDGLLLGRLISGLAAGNVAIASSIIADISTKNTKAIHYRIIQLAIGVGLIVGPAILSLCHYIFRDNQAIAITVLLFSVLQCILWFIVRYFFRETHQHRQMGKGNNFIVMTAPMRWALIVWTIYIAGLMLFGQFLPSILQQKFAYNSQKIAHYFLFMGVVYIGCQFYLVRYLVRFFSSQAMVCGFMIALSGCVAMFFTLTTAKYLWSVSIVYYICLALLMPNLYAVTSDAADENNQGYLMGKALSLQGAATVIASIVGGFFLTVNMHMIMLTTASLFFLAWGLFLFSRRVYYALV